MRTTLDIEFDILQAAKETARLQKRSAGAVISEWARSALSRNAVELPEPPRVESALARYGITPLPRRGGVVTSELVRRLMDEEGL